MAKELAKTNSQGDERTYHKPGVLIIDFHNRVATMKPHSYKNEKARRAGASFQKVLEDVTLDWDAVVEPIIAAAGGVMYDAWGEADAEIKDAKDV